MGMPLNRQGGRVRAPWGGGRAKIENSSRRHPRKFGLKRFLAVRRSWRKNGVACFELPPWKKFSAADSRSSRSAQEDGCSSLPCRGVLCFRSEAREASGSETPRVHNVARWCGGVAARGAGAAGGDATGRGVHASVAERPGDEGLSRRSRAGACAPRMKPKPQSATHISHLWRRRPNCQCRGGGLGETES